MKILLFDTEARSQLFPLTLTRAVADIRMGIATMREKWAKIMEADVFVLTDSYLQPLYEAAPAGEYIFIDARILPSEPIIKAISTLNEGGAIADENGLIAGKATIQSLPSLQQIPQLFANTTAVETAKRLLLPQEIFKWNAEMIAFDFNLFTKGRVSNDTNDTVHVAKASQIFVEDGAKISFSILNASEGPIYIGKNALIMEGCTIRGPFVLGEGAVLKMGSKIYGATTIGPYCSAGGEIKNVVMTGYSNKAHDGYLGDSVIGEWCNFGAGTSASNVKNTGSEVKVWNYHSKAFMPAGNKCGVIMGDYSRTAVNTSINTGTVAGVCCNIFSERLTPTFIPDFSWGCSLNEKYTFDKALKDIANWKAMKNKTLSEPETKVLKHIFDHHK